MPAKTQILVTENSKLWWWMVVLLLVLQDTGGSGKPNMAVIAGPVTRYLQLRLETKPDN